ncbi:hypothetical protein ACLMJK_001191 [Lecanora helva]
MTHLLALPLEIRHNIYSFLLIDTTPYRPCLIDIEPDDLRQTAVSLFLTCRQIYHEAFEYYYTMNHFMLSLISPYYNLSEINAQTDAILTRLRYVQRLLVTIHTDTEELGGHIDTISDYCKAFDSDSKYPKQQQQWNCFLQLFAKCEDEQGGRKLKHLTIQDLALGRGRNDNIDMDTPVYRSLLAPFHGKIAELRLIGGT